MCNVCPDSSLSAINTEWTKPEACSSVAKADLTQRTRCTVIGVSGASQEPPGSEAVAELEVNTFIRFVFIEGECSGSWTGFRSWLLLALHPFSFTQNHSALCFGDGWTRGKTQKLGACTCLSIQEARAYVSDTKVVKSAGLATRFGRRVSSQSF